MFGDEEFSFYPDEISDIEKFFYDLVRRKLDVSYLIRFSKFFAGMEGTQIFHERNLDITAPISELSEAEFSHTAKQHQSTRDSIRVFCS